jgi:hypothetical protein
MTRKTPRKLTHESLSWLTEQRTETHCTQHLGTLRDLIVAAGEEALVGIVGVRGGVMRGDVSVVVLGVLHEAIAVEPIVEDQNVVAWR